MIERSGVATLIQESCKAFDTIGQVLTERELQYRTVLLTTFTRFSAAAQILRRSPEDQLGMVIHGQKIVDAVLAQQGGAGRYGSGRKCVEVSTGEELARVKEIVELTLDETRETLARAELTFRNAVAQEKILIDRLLEFSVASRVLGADLTSQKKMMDAVTALVGKLIASGWLTRNEIRLR